MKLLFKILPLYFLFITAGCLEINTVIRLNNDGSGTIDETVMMNKGVIQMLSQLSASLTDSLSGDSSSQEGFKLFDPKALEDEAASFGKNVKYVEGKEITKETMEGYNALFSFKNIADLKLNQNPNRQIALEANEEDKEKVHEEFIRFEFTEGKPSELIVHLSPSPIHPDSAEQEPDSLQGSIQEFEEIKDFMKGLRIRLAVEVEGAIDETNAAFSEGSVVTLFDIDFDKLLNDPDRFKKFAEKNPQTLHEVKQMIHDFPGIKVELNDPLYIRFE